MTTSREDVGLAVGTAQPLSLSGESTEGHAHGSGHGVEILVRTVRGGGATMLAQGIKALLGLGATAALGRLLTPGDYGIYGMTIAATGVLFVFNEVGLSLATVQRERLSEAEINGAFYVQLMVSVAAALLACGLGPILAWLYREPLVTSLSLAIAPSFVVIGLYAQHHALLRREMRFTLLAVVDVASVATGYVVAIAAASVGLGCWALAMQPLAQFSVTLVAAWKYCAFRPARPSLQGSGTHLRFGVPFFGFRVVEYFGKTLDRILLGCFVNPTALGHYTRAFALVNIGPSQLVAPLSQVLFPGLCRLQSDPEEFSRMVTRASVVISWLALPMASLTIVGAHDLVIILLGPQWGDAGVIVRYASISMLGAPLLPVFGWLLLPLGKTNLMMRWGIASTAVSLGATAAAVPFGVNGVAVTVGTTSAVLSVAAVGYGCHVSHLRFLALARTLALPGALALISTLVGVHVLDSVVLENRFVHFSACAGFVMGVWGAAAWATGAHRQLLAVARILMGTVGAVPEHTTVHQP